jgi:LCP family protein required for cell wall assembly
MSASTQRTPRTPRTPGRPVARHGRRNARGPVAFIFSIIATVVAVVLVSATSVAAIAVWDISRSAQEGVTLANEPEVIPSIGAIEGGVNILLVGSDSRENTGLEEDGGVLNDVNMILHISADHTNAIVVSIPRDMVFPMADCPDVDGDGYSDGGGWTGPINAVLNEGGLPCVVLTVEQVTGLSIPYAALVNFAGVIEMATAIGGVDVCVGERIEDEYTGTFLDAGMHTLGGIEALQFLRTRHGVGDGSDLGRISNQQVFLSSMVRKLKSSETLTNPVKLYGIAKAALSNMQLSNSLNNVDTMVSIGLALRNIPLDSVVFVQYPGTTGGDGVYTARVQPIDWAAEELFAAILADQPVTVVGGTGVGSIVDPNADAQRAADAAAADAAKAKASASAAAKSKKTATPTPKPSTSSTPTATPTPTSVATQEAVAKVELSDEIRGQSANDYTCSKGRSLNDQ